MKLVLGKIEEMDTDAIACPSHSDLKIKPGIREAVFLAADTEKLTELCNKKGYCPIGKGVITPSCGLPSDYIIHIVGPGWYGGRKADRELFAACFRQAMHLAFVMHCKSLALPLMFSGKSHLPRAEALSIVTEVVYAFEEKHPEMEITLVLYNQGTYTLAEAIYESFLEDRRMRDKRFFPRLKKLWAFPVKKEKGSPGSETRNDKI